MIRTPLKSLKKTVIFLAVTFTPFSTFADSAAEEIKLPAISHRESFKYQMSLSMQALGDYPTTLVTAIKLSQFSQILNEFPDATSDVLTQKFYERMRTYLGEKGVSAEDIVEMEKTSFEEIGALTKILSGVASVDPRLKGVENLLKVLEPAIEYGAIKFTEYKAGEKKSVEELEYLDKIYKTDRTAANSFKDYDKNVNNIYKHINTSKSSLGAFNSLFSGTIGTYNPKDQSLTGNLTNMKAELDSQLKKAHESGNAIASKRLESIRTQVDSVLKQVGSFERASLNQGKKLSFDIANIKNRLDELDSGLEDIDGKLDGISSDLNDGFDNVNGKLDQANSSLNDLLKSSKIQSQQLKNIDLKLKQHGEILSTLVGYFYREPSKLSAVEQDFLTQAPARTAIISGIRDSATYIIGVIGGNKKVAAQINTLTNAYLAVDNSFQKALEFKNLALKNSYGTRLLYSTAQWATLASGFINSISLISTLSTIGQGDPFQNAVMRGLNDLMQMTNELRTEMHSRFDRLEEQMNQMYYLIEENFKITLSILSHIEDNTNALVDLSRKQLFLTYELRDKLYKVENEAVYNRFLPLLNAPQKTERKCFYSDETFKGAEGLAKACFEEIFNNLAANDPKENSADFYNLNLTSSTTTQVNLLDAAFPTHLYFLPQALTQGPLKSIDALPASNQMPVIAPWVRSVMQYARILDQTGIKGDSGAIMSAKEVYYKIAAQARTFQENQNATRDLSVFKNAIAAYRNTIQKVASRISEIKKEALYEILGGYSNSQGQKIEGKTFGNLDSAPLQIYINDVDDVTTKFSSLIPSIQKNLPFNIKLAAFHKIAQPMISITTTFQRAAVSSSANGLYACTYSFHYAISLSVTRFDPLKLKNRVFTFHSNPLENVSFLSRDPECRFKIWPPIMQQKLEALNKQLKNDPVTQTHIEFYLKSVVPEMANIQEVHFSDYVALFDSWAIDLNNRFFEKVFSETRAISMSQPRFADSQLEELALQLEAQKSSLRGLLEFNYPFVLKLEPEFINFFAHHRNALPGKHQLFVLLWQEFLAFNKWSSTLKTNSQWVRHDENSESYFTYKVSLIRTANGNLDFPLDTAEYFNSIYGNNQELGLNFNSHKQSLHNSTVQGGNASIEKRTANGIILSAATQTTVVGGCYDISDNQKDLFSFFQIKCFDINSPIREKNNSPFERYVDLLSAHLDKVSFFNQPQRATKPIPFLVPARVEKMLTENETLTEFSELYISRTPGWNAFEGQTYTDMLGQVKKAYMESVQRVH